MQDVGDDGAEPREPEVGGAARFAFGKNEGVVLVHGQQALAAAGRTEHAERIGTWRRALPVGQHAPLGQHAGAAG